MINKKSLLLILLGVLLLPGVASAQTITQIVANIVNAVWVAASGIVIVLWVVTGILFLAAQGAPEKLKQAKAALFAAIGGTAIIIIAYSAMAIIRNVLVAGA